MKTQIKDKLESEEKNKRKTKKVKNINENSILTPLMKFLHFLLPNFFIHSVRPRTPMRIERSKMEKIT